MINSQSVFQVSFAGSTWDGAPACSSDVKSDRVSPSALPLYSLLLPSLVCELLVSLLNTTGAGAHGAQSAPLSN